MSIVRRRPRLGRGRRRCREGNLVFAWGYDSAKSRKKNYAKITSRNFCRDGHYGVDTSRQIFGIITRGSGESSNGIGREKSDQARVSPRKAVGCDLPRTSTLTL